MQFDNKRNVIDLSFLCFTHLLGT